VKITWIGLRSMAGECRGKCSSCLDFSFYVHDLLLDAVSLGLSI
jgi:hypothetical protein